MNYRTLIASMAALLLVVPTMAWSQDRTEYEGCRACHERNDQGADHMIFTSDSWLASSHANTNKGFNEKTDCAVCHSPLQGTVTGDAPVPLEEWEAVTCASCHLPRAVATVVGTRLGNFVIGSGDEPNDDVPEYNGNWDEIYHGESTDTLCTNCHGVGHSEGKTVMAAMAHLQCIDCHMPKIPVAQIAIDPDNPPIRMTRTHDFDFPLEPEEADRLAAKTTFSCGTDGVGCHGEHSTEWAVDVILSGVIHDEVQVPEGDVWTLMMFWSGETSTVKLEPFAGILNVEVTDSSGAKSMAIGMEMDGVIFWMGTDGVIYFGNINREDGEMSGIALGGTATSGIWFAETAQ